MSEELPIDDEAVSNLKTQLTAIKAFHTSSAHRAYEKMLKVDIAGCETSILATPPSTQEAISFVLQLFGRLEELKRSLTFFEDSQTVLADKISQLEDSEQQRSEQQETQND